LKTEWAGFHCTECGRFLADQHRLVGDSETVTFHRWRSFRRRPILLTNIGRLSLRAAMKYAPATCQILCAELLVRPCHTESARASRKGGAMTVPDRYQWRRDKDGLGVWEHRGKVAVAGAGHSPVDRRWDGVSMDKTLGAYSILACRKAMDDAGVTPDQIDGVICCDSHIAGGSGGSASQWAPRPYFDPSYDSEWGLTLVNAKWLIAQMRLPNVKFTPTGLPTISEIGGTMGISRPTS
jgi:hypothetical protein